MKNIFLCLLICCAAFGAAQTTTVTEVTVASRGLDVREVLHDLFRQAKQNYVLDTMPRQSLFLSLDKMDFEEALHIVCKLSNLSYEVQNGVYFLSKLPVTKQAVAKPIESPKGKLPITALDKKVTTRLSKTELTAVFAELGKQTNIRIEFAPGIPAYKLDAFLIGTTLKYALETITKAAGLEYVLTERMSIMIQKPEANRVSLVKDGG